MRHFIHKRPMYYVYYVNNACQYFTFIYLNVLYVTFY